MLKVECVYAVGLGGGLQRDYNDLVLSTQPSCHGTATLRYISRTGPPAPSYFRCRYLTARVNSLVQRIRHLRNRIP